MSRYRLVVSVAALGIAAAGCSTRDTASPSAARPVRTEIVSETRPAPAVRYSASIDPAAQIAVAFRTTGYVATLVSVRSSDGTVRAAGVGDRVARGTALARLDDADYRERVGQARARMAESEAGRVHARLDLDRARALFGSDALTKPELDAAQATFDAAEARIAAARADLELASIALRDCALVAPAGGVVLERRIEVGSLAAAGTVGFVIGDLRSVEAHFGVPDSAIDSIRLGDRLDVAVEALGTETFAGTVTAVAPAADRQSRVFDVEVTLPNPDGRLRPGMIGTVAVAPAATATRQRAQPLVPLSAVVRTGNGNGEFAVLVVERGSATDVVRARQVRLGEVVGNGITVLDGVRPGDRVVVAGATLLADGDPVRVIPG